MAALAGEQRGLVTPRQLRAVGLSKREIERRVADGRLHRVFHGVYSVLPGDLDPLSIALASVLATAGRMSHQSCLAAHDLAEWPDKPQVTRPNGSARTDIEVHRSRLPTNHTDRHHGIDCTTVTRALLDVAETAPGQIDRLVRAAEYERLTSIPQLIQITKECPGRRGTATLLQVIADGPAPSKSEMERRFRRLIAEANLPRPLFNARVGHTEVDVLWPQHKLIVELDGWQGHSGRIAFENDRRRDAKLLRAGYRILRVTWRRLHTEPFAVIADVSSLLARP